MRIQTALQYLRLRPFDTSTDEGRTAERYRLALWSIVAEVLARLGSMLVVVASIKWATPYLGAERFGAWATISSLATMLSFLDLGVANALTTRVAQAMRTGGAVKAAPEVSRGLFILGGISLAVSTVLFAIAWSLPWHRLLNLSTLVLGQEVSRAAQVLALLFGASLWSNGLARVLQGLQRAYWVHVASLIGSLCSLVAMYVATNHFATIPVLLTCQLAPPTLAVLLLALHLKQLKLFSWQQARLATQHAHAPLLQSAGLFFLLQVSTTIGWNADSLLLASVAGTSSVASFSVTQRLFQFISQPLAVINAPLWSAYADAQAARDQSFIRNTFARSIALTAGLAAAGSLACVAVGQDIVQAWTGGTLHTTLVLLSAMAAWTLLETTGNALAMLLNGLNIVRQQVWTAGLFIALAIPTKYVLASRFDAPGLILGSIITYVIAIGVGYGMLFRKDIAAHLR
jgi:O-antigen/teichoic acid export membrane protein